MTYSILRLIAIASMGFVLFACSKEVVEVERFGDIEGIVLDAESYDTISGVNITTQPASNSILNNDDGTFFLQHLPTGSYQVRARKKGFRSETVSVAVTEDGTATAEILLEEADDSLAASGDMNAEVTSWANTTSNDSSFVEVDYRFTNVSSSSDFSEYEVYFEIITDGDTFYHEVTGEGLRAGQQHSGDFRKYIRQTTASDVIVSDVWVVN